MNRIAVVGAGGYVGARMIEQAELLGDLPLVPIVRSRRSQGRLARFGTCTVEGDAGDSQSLAPLLEGCGMAVNLTMGDDDRIVPNVKAIHEACRVAGVPLLVHISSAEVFGRAEDPDLREDSVPSGEHWMEYARAKAAAETWLRSQFDGPVKVVILRPGLIWGPGSGWLVEPAQALGDGIAYLFNSGRGICNLIHVDNLIEHLEQLSKVDPPASGIFNVSDLETHTWLDFYTAIAHEIGADPESIRMLPDGAFREDSLEKVLGMLQLPPAKAIKSRMTNATKVRLKQQLTDRLRPPIRESTPFQPSSSIAKPQWWLQGTVHKLPAEQFKQRYPDTRLQDFPELMTAAGEWLRYAGFGNRI